MAQPFYPAGTICIIICYDLDLVSTDCIVNHGQLVFPSIKICVLIAIALYLGEKRWQGKVDVHAMACSSSDCDISSSPSGLHFTPHPTYSSVQPLIQNAPVPWEQYLLLTEEKGHMLHYFKVNFRPNIYRGGRK